MDFVFEKSIDFYGIFELIYTKKWSTLYLFKIILQYISSWWRCSNSRAINFHSFLDFLLPILHTSILNVNDFFNFQPWNFFYHDFMILWSTVLQIIIKKGQKYTQAFYFFFKVVCEKIFRNHKILGKIKAGRFRIQDLFCNFLSLTKSVCKVL